MKIKIVLFALSLICWSAKANPLDSANLKPIKGNVSIEVNFDPSQLFAVSERGQFSLINDGVKVRYFLSPTTALRGVFDLTFNVTAQIIGEYEDYNYRTKDLKKYVDNYELTFTPGYEKHFKGTRCLSPYLGGQFLISYSNYRVKEEYVEHDELYNNILKNPKGNNTGLRLGLGAFVGVDYYIMKNLYLGLEIMYGFNYVNLNNEKHIDRHKGVDEVIKAGYMFAVAPRLTTSNFRIGWNF